MQKEVKNFLKRNWIILCVIALALIIRLWGIHPGYTTDHPDEPGSYRTAVHMFYNFLMPGRFDYPAGMPFLHLLMYIIFIFPFVFLNLFISHPNVIIAFFAQGIHFFSQYQEAIFGVNNINALYWSRYIAALFGVGGVILTYLTAKRLFNKRVGIFAAIFLAFNFRHVLASHFGLPDIHSSFFNILTLFTSVLLLEKNTRRRYVFAGVSAALALSIKYQPFAFLPLFVVHLLWAIKKRSFFYIFNINFVISIIISFFTFVLMNPYYLFNVGEAMYQNNKDYVRYGMGQLWLRGYQLFYLFNWGIGKLPSVAILLGLLLMFLRSFKKFLIIFSFASAFFFVMTYYSSAYTRNFTAVMPYLMIFAGYFIDKVYFLFRKLIPKVSTFLIVILLLILNFSSIKNVIVLDINFSKPWNFIALSEWFDNNLPENTIVRKYDLGITPEIQLSLKDKGIIFKEWDYSNGPNSLAEFQEEGTNFSALDTYTFYFMNYWWSGWKDPLRFLKYDNVPFDYVQDSYFGLTIKELMRYTIYELYQPWQAQTLKNYLVFKIPQKQKDLGKLIASFSFDANSEGWKENNPFVFPQIEGGWIKNYGKTSAGSLTIKSAGDSTQRLSSQPIKIVPGKLYTIKGNIKFEKSYSSSDQDGFLRLDVYRDIAHAKEAKMGQEVAVSPRAYENGGWETVEGSMVTPSDAKYLVISYQRKNTRRVENYLDDVFLYESDNIPEELFKNLRHIQPTIPLSSIYYISFL